jgi:CRP-like cAMP-binding protein
VQQERATRVVDTLLEIGFVAAQLHNYMGPKLHDLNLGVLGPGEFLGELALLPIEGGWRHQRTAMVVQNAMLHTLAKTDIERVSARFPELHDRMFDHAEELQKMQITNAAATGVEKLSKHQAKISTAKTRSATLAEQDPLAVVKAQLNQQEAKLDRLHIHCQQQDIKLDQLLAKLDQLIS